MSLHSSHHDPHYLSRALRIMDEHSLAGLHPDDLFEPSLNRHHLRSHAGYMRPWRSSSSHHDTGSTVSCDKDKFQVNLDVQQFRPEEITVKVVGENVISVEGKHEEKEDHHGFISRHFVRKYVLPKQYDVARVESKLSSDGVLTISAPNNNPAIEHREIPIIKTREPARIVAVKKDDKK